MKTNPYKNNKPQYKNKHDKYIIPIYRNKVMMKKYYYDNDNKLIKIKNKLTDKEKSKRKTNTNHKFDYHKKEYYVVIPCGKLISDNYIDITDNHNLVKIKSTKLYDFYLNKKHLVELDKSTKGYIKCGDKYYHKDDPNIINGYHLYIKTNKYIANNVKYMEIVPFKDTYKIVYNFDVPIEKKPIRGIKNVASGDLGMVNLITLYTPYDYPLIIPGTPIKSWNRFYGMKIDVLNSEISKGTKLVKKTNKINKPSKNKKINEYVDPKQLKQELLKRRENKINDYMTKVTNVIIRYCENNNIDTFIMGYNEGWKQKLNLSKRFNRDFTSYPHKKLIDKITAKAAIKGIKIILQEEAHTSKCDALAFESIEHHKKYKGERSKRGLYKSSTGLEINADVNGAINIMRKNIESISPEMRIKIREDIRLSTILRFVKNPKKINVWEELRERKKSTIKCTVHDGPIVIPVMENE
jgi:putative transposase